MMKTNTCTSEQYYWIRDVNGKMHGMWAMNDLPKAFACVKAWTENKPGQAPYAVVVGDLNGVLDKSAVVGDYVADTPCAEDVPTLTLDMFGDSYGAYSLKSANKNAFVFIGDCSGWYWSVEYMNTIQFSSNSKLINNVQKCPFASAEDALANLNSFVKENKFIQDVYRLVAPKQIGGTR